jgi:hypothetical protein
MPQKNNFVALLDLDVIECDMLTNLFDLIHPVLRCKEMSSML